MPNEEITPEGVLEQQNTEDVTVDAGDVTTEIEDTTDWKTEALKYKAIADRLGRKSKEVSISVPVPAVKRDEFLTKADFYKSNERKGILMATTLQENDSADIKEMKATISDKWSDISTFYTGRSGKDTPEDIAEDIYDAYVTWRRRNPSKEPSEEKDVKTEVGIDTVITGKTPPPAGSQRKSIIKKQAPMNEWYT